MDVRLAYVVSHPIQYQAPLLRRLAQEPGLRMKTFFLTDAGSEPFFDAGFGRTLQWDVPLVGGYDHQFVARNLPLPLRFNEPRFSWTRAFRGERFDAVWVSGYAHGPLLRAIGAAKARRMKVIVRGESHDGLRRPTTWRLTAQRLLFQCVDAFLAIGSRNRDYYLGRGVDARRIHLAPYSVDNDFFRMRLTVARQRRQALLKDLNLSASQPIVLFASKLQPRKRCADLLRAFAPLDGAAQLVIVGDGPERPALEEFVREHQLRRVRFAGFRNQSEMPSFYDLCDLFVLPSDGEPWGLVVNEAMNAAKPVVVSDAVGAARDLVVEGDTGFIYPVGDIAALRAAVQRLVGDAQLRQRMGVAARTLVSGWGIDATVRGVRAALEAVAVR
jgi:glycosyltransferase involved in cell wall biosynthesis